MAIVWIRWARFNPTLVRLRRVSFSMGKMFKFMFQSHAGSIEASAGMKAIPAASAFQSHAGSIEARRSCGGFPGR